MNQHRGLFKLEQMAHVLGVSCSGYYDYINRKPSRRAVENARLVDHIQSIFEDSYQTYGSPRIHAQLCQQGYHCSRSRVARLMKAHHIQAKTYKKFVKTTQRSVAFALPDLVQQQFEVAKPNSLWVADITYIRIAQKWAYLAVVLDVYARKIVGMALDNHMKAD